MKNSYELTEHLKRVGVLRSPGVIESFRKTDRKDFVRDKNAYDIYEDYPLPIGFGQTISQPYTVAFMLELLDVKEDDDVLDIGSGSGWTTALIAGMLSDKGSVTGVERVEKLAEFGNNNLSKYHYPNAKILHRERGIGIEGSSFDRILVSAAADELPNKLLKQLKNGGTLVIPVRNSIFCIKKDRWGKTGYQEYQGFVFVPLVL